MPGNSSEFASIEKLCGMRSFAHNAERSIDTERRIAMLQIKHLSITHKKDLRTILKDFQFVLNTGDKAVIIGEEGNGKSTLLKWIYDPQLIESYTEVDGERICNGEKLAYLPQELKEEDKHKSVYEFFCEEPFFWEQTPKQMNQMTSHLQLPTDFFYEEQKMETLSGGERVKVQMARILMSEPTILLLDEPSNDIDITTLEWLEHLITESRQAVLFISHDETLIENTANVVIHLEQIRRKTISRYTVAHMPYIQYLEHRKSTMRNQEQRASTERRQEQIRQNKFRHLQQKVEHSLNAATRQDPHTAQLIKKKMKTLKSMEKRYEREAEDMTQMPESEDAIFIRFSEEIKIPSGKTLLEFSLEELKTSCVEENSSRVLAKHIFLQIRGAQKVCIIGKNGAGKTTLIKLIAEQMLKRVDIRAAYMPQNYENLLDMAETPVDYLSVTGDKKEVTQIRTYLSSMKYTIDEMSRPIAELSEGQKAKIFLLKMSMSGANVLILDEPTRNFSPLSNPVIREVLSAYQGAIISISHDRKYIKEVCDSIYSLDANGLKKIEEKNEPFASL